MADAKWSHHLVWDPLRAKTARTLRRIRAAACILWDLIRAMLPQDSPQREGVGVAMRFRLTLRTLRRFQGGRGNDQPVSAAL